MKDRKAFVILIVCSHVTKERGKCKSPSLEKDRQKECMSVRRRRKTIQAPSYIDYIARHSARASMSLPMSSFLHLSMTPIKMSNGWLFPCGKREAYFRQGSCASG